MFTIVNPITKAKEYVKNHPEQVEEAKKIGIAIGVNLAMAVFIHYASKAVIQGIDNFFEQETGIDEVIELD